MLRLRRDHALGLALVILGALCCTGATCGGPPPAPEELPPRFVFRVEFRDPCNMPIPGVQYDLYADPLIKRPKRAPESQPHEWQSHVRGQADEFGEARVDLGTDWGSLVDVYAAFAGQISEVRAAPDCYLEIANRSIVEVVLDTFTCSKSKARAERSEEPHVTLYARTFRNTHRRRRRAKVQCRDAPPAETPEETEARLKKQKRL